MIKKKHLISCRILVTTTPLVVGFPAWFIVNAYFRNRIPCASEFAYSRRSGRRVSTPACEGLRKRRGRRATALQLPFSPRLLGISALVGSRCACRAQQPVMICTLKAWGVELWHESRLTQAGITARLENARATCSSATAVVSCAWEQPLHSKPWLQP